MSRDACRCGYNVARAVIQIEMAQDSLDSNDSTPSDIHASISSIDSILNDVEVACDIDSLGARGEIDRALNYYDNGMREMARGALSSSRTRLMEDLLRCSMMLKRHA